MKKKIFVVCPYMNWGDYWFKELINFFSDDPRIAIGMKVNKRHRIIDFPIATIQFVPETKIKTYTQGLHNVAVINWTGNDVAELAQQIVM